MEPKLGVYMRMTGGELTQLRYDMIYLTAIG